MGSCAASKLWAQRARRCSSRLSGLAYLGKVAKPTIPVVVIEYALTLPADRSGELVAKTVSRVLKHSFKAKQVRIQMIAGEHPVRRLSATIEKRHLESVRGAVQMVMQARGMGGPLIRDPKTLPAFFNLPPTPFRRLERASGEQGPAEGDGDCRAPSGGALQAQPEPAANEPSAVA
jgi:hypothetical protein